MSLDYICFIQYFTDIVLAYEKGSLLDFICDSLFKKILACGFSLWIWSNHVALTSKMVMIRDTLR